MRTKVLVSAGAADHASGGEVSAPSQVCLAGIGAMCLKADETSFIGSSSSD
jgi:hypothetical protein